MSDNQNEDNPGLIMPPPYFLGVALVVAFVGQNVWPVIFLPRGLGWAFYLGLLLIVGAMALAVSAWVNACARRSPARGRCRLAAPMRWAWPARAE